MMNERIREIAEQAGFNPYNYQGSNSALFEKFALLIIQECASKVTRNEALNIFEHFGVRE
jgi:hypothetical protein